MWDLKKNKQANKKTKTVTDSDTNTENKMMVARGEVGRGMGEIVEADKEVQTCGYKINHRDEK